jgi:aryl-alcohol dehydrogenase-like predicted oxidoreductase
MEYCRLGRTNHLSSVVILGAAAYWDGNAAETESSFNAALAAGVNHIDVAPQYGDAQRVLGPLIGARREELFIACKTLRHNPDGVRAQLEESLTLLHCDAFDLYQLHAVTDLEELDARSGAVEVLLAAREEGVVSAIGITGHNMTTPAAQLEALRRYDLDTIMFPVNARLWADSEYRRDAEALLELAIGRDCGVMAIKTGAARPWAGRTPDRDTWYEPYGDADDLLAGLRFTLSTPGVHAACSPGDRGILRTLLSRVDDATSMSDDERAALMAERASERLIFPMGSA